MRLLFNLKHLKLKPNLTKNKYIKTSSMSTMPVKQQEFPPFDPWWFLKTLFLFCKKINQTIPHS